MSSLNRKTDIYQKLIVLHRLKNSPGPYDWLSVYPEEGQTFDQFVLSQPSRPDDKKKYIYITMLGEFDKTKAEIIEKTAKFIEAYFGLEVKFADSLDLAIIPKEAQRIHPSTFDKQILTSFVIESVLKPNMPKDAFCFIAFTSSDLWPGEGWNFVFGQASWEDRVGVWSIYRNGDPNWSQEEYQLCLKRTIKTGTHEIAHMFSLHHCIFYECNMNGSNHRIENDQRPLWLCPVCLKKLCWLLDLDPQKRYNNLRRISLSYGFQEDASFYQQSLQILEK